MSSIVPPLDYIPKLPSKAVSEIIKKVDKQTDKLLNTVTTTLQESAKISTNVKSNDPRIKNIKEQVNQIQTQITKLQETIPKIQTAIAGIKTIVTTATGIKSVITIAQLSNPVTAPLFIAQQAMAIQDATIVNAIESLKQIERVPETLMSKIQTIMPPLIAILKRIESIDGNDADRIIIPNNFLSDSTILNNNINARANDLTSTDFYNEYNVSSADLDARTDTIQQLLDTQQDLLTSLQEAPSIVIQGTGRPVAEIGKAGDYYIDISSNTVYGPKVSSTSWI